MFDLSTFALLTGLATLALGLYVLASERVSRVSLALFATSVAVGAWLLCYHRLYATDDPAEALRWVRLAYVFIPFIPAAVLQFTHEVLQIPVRRSPFARLGWLFGILFALAASQTDALIEGLYRYEWGFYARYGWLGVPFLVYFALYLLRSVALLWNDHRTAEPGVHRVRAGAFAAAFALAQVGAIDFLPKYGIGVYPVGFIFIALFIAACVYVARHYRFVAITPSFAAGEIVETMSDALIVCDASGRIRVTNPAATRILEHDEEQLLGREAASLAPEHPETRRRWRSVLERSGVRDEEVELRTSRGEPVALSVSTSDLRDPYGAVVGRVVIARDIRARKRTLAELRDREERYRSLFEQNPDPVYSVDLEGRFTSANEACSVLTGYPADALVGMPYQALLAPEHEALALTHFHRVLAGEPQAFELSIVTGSGRRIDLSVTSLPIVVEEEVVGVYGIAKDVTEHRRAEEALARRTVQLERSNRELEQFAYVASHDLQEPLRKIQAFGDRLRLKHADSLEGSARDYLERMLGATGRMRALIQELLAFSRVASNRQPFEPVDLAMIAAGVVSDLEERIAQTGGRVIVGDLPTLPADPLQMRQLLQNLVGNALKFHRPDAPPVVELSARVPDPETPAVEITVSDNGIGFDEKYLDRIFTPFQRLHGRMEYEGTGMGLAICRKIVEHHGGEITAHSTPGGGATFVVTLPAHSTEPSLV